MYINGEKGDMTLKIDGSSLKLESVNLLTKYDQHKNGLFVKNQNTNKCGSIECHGGFKAWDTVPDTLIVNKNATIIKKNDNKIILKKAEDDAMNLEYAFLYGYFLMNSGMSKTAASKFLKSLRGFENE